MGLFKRGFQAVDEEQERQEELREKLSNRIDRFFLKNDKDYAPILFLTEDPVCYQEHTIKKYVNGKEVFDNIPCIGKGCKHCADGDRPSFKSAWLIVDQREYEYTDSKGKKKQGKNKVRLLVYGTKMASQLSRKSERYGLVGNEYDIERIGTGTSTSYNLERGERIKLTSKKIESFLPDFLKEQYDGTMDSLYDIIEEQILRLVDDKEDTRGEYNDDEDEEDDYDDSIVNVDEDEEDYDEEEEEVRRPRKSKSKSSGKSKIKAKGSSKSKTSIKSKKKRHIEHSRKRVKDIINSREDD